MPKLPLVILASATLLLGACQKEAATTPQTANTASTAAASSAATAGSGATSATAAVDYAAYAGKYPFDKVNNVAFLDLPEVAAAVRTAVGNETLLNAMRAISGPGTPIFRKGNKLGAWQCQEHNCGPHNWTVLFDPSTKTAEVCYSDTRDEPAKHPTQWYVNGRSQTRPGDCPSE